MHLSFYAQIATITQLSIITKITLCGGLLNHFAVLVTVNDIDHLEFCILPS